MIIRESTLYICEHCNKRYLRKHFCEKHEDNCFHNPKNHRPCLVCPHLKMRATTVTFDHGGYGETELNVSLLYCDRVGHFLYPPQVQNKKKWFETDPIINAPMPVNCEIFNEEEKERKQNATINWLP